MKTVTVAELIACAARVGVTIHRTTPDDANIYVWATNPGEEVLYIGKQSSKRRLAEETNWSKQNYRRELWSPIVALLGENNAISHPLRYDPDVDFDGAQARAAVAAGGWDESAFTEVAKWLDDGSRFCGGAEIERFLIRIAVRSGAPIGNSALAGQWESMIGRYSDTLAFISHTTKG